MKIYFHLRFIALFICTWAAKADISPLPAFTLKLETSPSDPLHDLGGLKSPFYFVVKEGEAFLAQDESPKRDADKRKGTVDFVIRNGLDPATKTFKAPILYLMFRHDVSGWADDRFITEIVVPFSMIPHAREERRNVPRPIGPIQFADQATMTTLWQKESQASIRIIGDPMDVRSVQPLKCTTVSSNLQITR